MGTTEIASYVLAVLGAGLAAYAAVVVNGATINVGVATEYLVKLAKVGNLARLVKLASSSTDTYFDAVRAGVIAAGASGSKDRVTIAAALAGGFDPVAATFVARWKAWSERGLAGGLAVAGALAVAYNDASLGVPHYVLGAVAAIACGVIASRRGHPRLAIATTRRDVLPVVIDALAAGSTLDSAPAHAPVEGPGVTFTIARDGEAPRVETLRELVIKVGRMPTSHLRLDDPDVSRMHAVIERTDSVTIIDLGSQVGTLVNGKRVNKATLATGDRVTIGPFEVGIAIGTDAPIAVDPFRTPAAVSDPSPPNAPSLRDGTCPICRHATIKTIARTDSRFEALVCAGCGYTQEFADLAKLDA